jgi:hypothetical protein
MPKNRAANPPMPLTNKAIAALLEAVAGADVVDDIVAALETEGALVVNNTDDEAVVVV